MLRFIVRRVLVMVPILLGISLVMFVLLRVVPGDPAVMALNLYATPERVAELRALWGVDRPIIEQYGIFLTQLAHGDLGYSYFYKQPAMSLVLERLGPELALIAATVGLTLVIGVPLASV